VRFGGQVSNELGGNGAGAAFKRVGNMAQTAPKGASKNLFRVEGKDRGGKQIRGEPAHPVKTIRPVAQARVLAN
jgi:hypothetical protein